MTTRVLGLSAIASLVARIRGAIESDRDFRRYAPRIILGYLFILAVYCAKRAWRRDYVICAPAEPGPSYTLWKLCMLAGIKIVPESEARRHRRRSALCRVWHNDQTYEVQEHPGYLNGRCTDISKSRVDAVFHEVFGYATRVDPVEYVGQAVMKPEENCSGVGVLVDLPLAPERLSPHHLYQKLVDNTIGDGLVREYRVTVMFGTISDVICQDRLEAGRLIGRGAGGARSSRVVAPEDIFSGDEIAKILRFCEKLGLEFGELDILPDTCEGRVYILDANKTPTTMVKGSAFRIQRMLQLLRRATMFRRLLLSSG